MSDAPTDSFWKQVVWSQMGASIDSLRGAIELAPPEVWGDRIGPYEFWYLAYHTIFWLDCRLHPNGDDFVPPPPFTLGEMDPAGVYPDRVYTKEEMLDYLGRTREKARAVIAAMTDDEARRPWAHPWSPTMPRVEWILQSIRHNQHHTAQLNWILRHRIDAAARWVTRAPDPLEAP